MTFGVRTALRASHELALVYSTHLRLAGSIADPRETIDCCLVDHARQRQFAERAVLRSRVRQSLVANVWSVSPAFLQRLPEVISSNISVH
jgi:hypothetical protein